MTSYRERMYVTRKGMATVNAWLVNGMALVTLDYDNSTIRVASSDLTKVIACA